MLRFLLLEFPLEIYGIHEFRMIYWYAERIYRIKARLLRQAEIERERAQGSQSPPSTSLEIVLPTIMQVVCQGVYMALTFFKVSGLYKDQQSEFDTEELRYEARFAPFYSTVAPSVYPYSSYRQSIDQLEKMEPSKLLEMARGTFEVVRKNVDTIRKGNGEALDEETSRLLNVCKANEVVLKLFQKIPPKKLPSPSFSKHPYFPVFKFER